MGARSAVGQAGPFWDSPRLGLRILFVRAWRLERWGHAHMGAPWWRWYWNDTVGMRIRHGEQVWDLSPKHILLIPPNTDFNGSLEQPCGHLSIPFVLPDEAMTKGLGPQHIAIDGWASEQRLRQVFGSLLERHSEHRQQFEWSRRLEIEALVLGALSRLPEQSWSQRHVDKRVQSVQDRLRDNLLTPPSNEQLAADMNVHPATLVRLCKQQLGYSPQLYALRMRLQGACEDLVQEGRSVDEVVGRWGFTDRQHLTRQMKRHFFCTPGSLRRQHGNLR